LAEAYAEQTGTLKVPEDVEIIHKGLSYDWDIKESRALKKRLEEQHRKDAVAVPKATVANNSTVAAAPKTAKAKAITPKATTLKTTISKASALKATMLKTTPKATTAKSKPAAKVTSFTDPEAMPPKSTAKTSLSANAAANTAPVASASSSKVAPTALYHATSPPAGAVDWLLFGGNQMSAFADLPGSP
jgi:hypothetical protein